jgi:hypothetical protein
MKRLIWSTVTILIVGGSVSAGAWYGSWQHWLAHQTGSLNTTGTPPNYNYWSGFGSVFPWSMGILATLMIGVYHGWRHKNCHTHGCWRIGSFPVAGGYRVCRKCHSSITGHEKMTVEKLTTLHREEQNR